MKKIIRTSTISLSLDLLLKGQLSFLNDYFNIIAVSGEDEHLKNVSKREGVRIVNVEMQRQISPFKDFISLYKLYKTFKREKPFIVHSITPKAGLLSMIASYFAGVPIRVHTFTGLIFPSKKGVMKEILIFMDKMLCYFATNIYPEGQGVKNDLIKYKITSKSLKIIANGNVNGIDIAFFSPTQIANEQKQQLRKELNVKESDFVFVFVGRLVRDKGINELVLAFSKLENSNVKLLLVGSQEFDLDPLLPNTLNEIKINTNIISVGFQNDVRPYFAISNCLVFPSYREGFPNVVMQAGAMELPSIVSDINGCNEIIVQNENGIIIPVKDVESLKLAMIKLKEDEVLYQKLKQNSRLMIVSRYEQSVVWNALLNEYNTLLKEKGYNV